MGGVVGPDGKRSSRQATKQVKGKKRLGMATRLCILSSNAKPAQKKALEGLKRVHQFLIREAPSG